MYGTVLKENESYYLVNETLRVMCDKGFSGGGEVVCGTDGTWIFSGSPCSKCEELFSSRISQVNRIVR